jgi:hypothetical protein
MRTTKRICNADCRIASPKPGKGRQNSDRTVSQRDSVIRSRTQPAGRGNPSVIGVQSPELNRAKHDLDERTRPRGRGSP